MQSITQLLQLFTREEDKQRVGSSNKEELVLNLFDCKMCIFKLTLSARVGPRSR